MVTFDMFSKNVVSDAVWQWVFEEMSEESHRRIVIGYEIAGSTRRFAKLVPERYRDFFPAVHQGVADAFPPPRVPTENH